MTPDEHDRLVRLLTVVGLLVIFFCYLASRVA